MQPDHPKAYIDIIAEPTESRSFSAGSFVALGCLLMYVGALIFGGYKVYTSIVERRNLATREFNNLVDISSPLVSSEAGFSKFISEEAQDTLLDTIKASKTLEGVIISGPGVYTIERERGTVITWLGDAPRFKSGFLLSKEPFHRPLPSEYRNVSISAVYSVIDYDFLITILKYTLLLIFIGLCIAFVTMVVEFAMDNKLKSCPAEAPVDAPEETVMVPGVQTFKPEKKKDVFDQNAFDELEIETDAAHWAAKKTAQGTTKTSEPLLEVEKARTEKTSMYTLRSICREDQTHDRLTAELQKCTVTGEDLVLLFMDLASSDPLLYRRFAVETLKFFAVRDLIFEKGAQGISVILPDHDLDQGLSMAGTFYKRFVDKQTPLFKGGIKLYIGMSSRSGRAVEGERIVVEAQSALEKALTDPESPIVAFRTNAEKYRTFLNSQQG
jgi:hypothetical protein